MGAGHTHHSDLGRLTRSKTIRLGIALGLTLVFVVVEVIAGLMANSLALLSDAAHNFTDVVALGLSWYALRLALRPANSRKTYGYHRAGILVAMVNSGSLLAIALGIFYEAYERVVAPPDVNARLLMEIGGLALLINVLTAWLVKPGSEHDLNLRSAFVHLMGDVLSTLGAVVAGVAILYTGHNWLDPAVSVLIGGMILWNAWGILRETVEILLEGTPRDIDMSLMVRDLLLVKGVRGVHDLHVWSLSQSLRALSAHIVVDDIAISDGGGIRAEISSLLASRYGIGHTTLQLECGECAPDLLYCALGEKDYRHHGHAH